MNATELKQMQAMFNTAVANAIAPIQAEIDAIKGNLTPEPTVSKIKRTQKQGNPDTGDATVDTCTVKVERTYQWVVFPAKPIRTVLDAMADWKANCPGGGGYVGKNGGAVAHREQHYFRCPPEKFDLVKHFAEIGITAKLVR